MLVIIFFQKKTSEINLILKKVATKKYSEAKAKEKFAKLLKDKKLIEKLSTKSSIEEERELINEILSFCEIFINKQKECTKFRFKKNFTSYEIIIDSIIWVNNLDLFKLIIIKKPEFLKNKIKNSKNTVLDIAILFKKIKFINFLLESVFELNQNDKNIINPLLFAADSGIIEIVKLLVKNKADINAKDEDGWTPLHIAASNGYLKILKFLIDNGADINAKNNAYLTVFNYAESIENLEDAKFLIKNARILYGKNSIKFIDFINSSIINEPFELCSNHCTHKTHLRLVKKLLKNFKILEELIEKDENLLNNLSKKLTLEQKLELENKIKERIKNKKEELKKLLQIQLSYFITQNNLGEISDNSPENILNSFIELNPNLNVNQVKIQENSVTETSAIVESNDQNYFGYVLATFTITKKENKPNQSQIKITEDEYKKQGARPKGSKVIPNQASSNTDNSNASIGGGESSIGIQQNTMYNVSADNICLFWAVANAYLLPVRNNNEEFKKRFIQLFG